MIETIAAIMIWPKALYFLKMNDNISPLVEIMFKVKYLRFLLIFIYIQMLFANIFWLLGRNQIQCVEIEGKKGECETESLTLVHAHVEGPIYLTLTGALRFVYYISLGEFEFRNDFSSDGERIYTFMGYEFGLNNVLQWFFFFIATFLLLIHLMNLLIGIIVDTFA